MGNATSSEAQIQFRSAITDLLSKEVDPNDTVFWKNIWETPQSAEDIFTHVSPRTVRTLIKSQPKNVQTLVSQAVSQMCFFVEHPDHEFHTHALNCVRFLTRIMPFLFETMKEDEGNLINELFWKVPVTNNVTATTTTTTTTNNHNNNTIDILPSSGEKKEATTTASTTPTMPATVPTTGPPHQECVGKRMVSSMMRMFFIPDFTIIPERFTALCRPPPRKKDSYSKDEKPNFPESNPGHIWEYGLGCPYHSATSVNWGANARIELNSERRMLQITSLLHEYTFIKS
jgi:hypothetical protein